MRNVLAKNLQAYFVSFLDSFRLRSVRYSVMVVSILVQVCGVFTSAQPDDSWLKMVLGNLTIVSMLAVIVFSTNWKQLLVNFLILSLSMPTTIVLLQLCILALKIASRVMGHSDYDVSYFLREAMMIGQVFGLVWAIWAFILGPKLIAEALALHVVRLLAVKKLSHSEQSSMDTKSAA
jgi:hypothetical protein